MELVEVAKAGGPDLKAIRALEEGNILFFPQGPFEVSEEDRAALLGAGQADGNFHKNIAYRPLSGKLTGLGDAAPGEGERVHRAMKNYSAKAIRFLEDFAAPYRKQWHMDYASFRSIEEQGRVLPLKKRNDLLHTDAFPTRPTNGGLILRFFTNVNPERTRDWITSDPFAHLAPRYAEQAGLKKIADRAGRSSRNLARPLLRAGRSLGLPVVDRSPYDEFMLGFHDFLKMNETYQRECTKYPFAFPPNGAWMVFTDVVPHAVMAGRYALEQTMIVPRQALLEPRNAPASILEQIAGRKLTYS